LLPARIPYLGSKRSEDVSHQMNGSLESEAVSRLGMLQLLRDALINKRDVNVRYLGLLHTHAAEPSDDATYTDYCDDTGMADPHNVMTQGKRGRSKDPSVIHLTADQVARARGYLFGQWPNLVADTGRRSHRMRARPRFVGSGQVSVTPIGAASRTCPNSQTGTVGPKARPVLRRQDPGKVGTAG